MMNMLTFTFLELDSAGAASLLMHHNDIYTSNLKVKYKVPSILHSMPPFLEYDIHNFEVHFSLGLLTEKHTRSHRVFNSMRGINIHRYSAFDHNKV